MIEDSTHIKRILLVDQGKTWFTRPFKIASFENDPHSDGTIPSRVDTVFEAEKQFISKDMMIQCMNVQKFTLHSFYVNE